MQWVIPLTLSGGDLTGLHANFDGSSFNGGAPSALNVRLLNDADQVVGTWTVPSPLVGYGTATFNPGGALPNGPYRIVATWTRNSNSSGTVEGTFALPGQGSESLGPVEVVNGSIIPPEARTNGVS